MTTAPTLLLPDQLMRLLELTQQSDSVELKLTVPASEYRSAARALAIDPIDQLYDSHSCGSRARQVSIESTSRQLLTTIWLVTAS